MPVDEKKLKRIVQEGGGTWMGLQDRSPLGQEPLVLFDDKHLDTLALAVSDVTVETVKSRIASNNILW